MASIRHLARTALSDWTSTIYRGLRETTMGYGLDSELLADDLDRFLATLSQRYRGASAAAAAARAEYWALRSEPDAQLAELESTRRQWQRLEYRRYEIASQIEHLAE